MSVNVTRVVKFRRKPAVLRGPQAWSDCADGYSFQSGGDGDEWKDVVMYGDNFYSCMVNHSKTPTNYPGSSDDQANGYWRLGDKIELVATKLLLAQYALVKNLGVECIDMKDAEGNILFQAKDGNVTCKTGTFENVEMSEVTCNKGTFENIKITGEVIGDITATNANLKICTSLNWADNPALPDGAVILQSNAVLLPELPVGVVRTLKVLNPRQSAAAAADLELIGDTDNVRISRNADQNISQPKVTLNGYGRHSGKCLELIGIGFNSVSTVWLISEMKNGIS